MTVGYFISIKKREMFRNQNKYKFRLIELGTDEKRNRKIVEYTTSVLTIFTHFENQERQLYFQ